jgi:hypothetical protein
MWLNLALTMFNVRRWFSDEPLGGFSGYGYNYGRDYGGQEL